MASIGEESDQNCKNELTQEEAFRYSRQMILPEIGLGDIVSYDNDMSYQGVYQIEFCGRRYVAT